VVVATLISAKAIHYILPLYPAAALIVGRFISINAGATEGELSMLDTIGAALGLLLLFVTTTAFAALPFVARVPPLDACFSRESAAILARGKALSDPDSLFEGHCQTKNLAIFQSPSGCWKSQVFCAVHRKPGVTNST